MKKLKIIFLAYVLCSVTGCFIFDECFFATDCGNPDEKLPTYANKSGEAIKIITVTEDRSYGEKFIANGDTLHNYSIEERHIFCPAGYSLPFCRSNIRVELHFLGESEKCLIFDGPIKNDGIDMRSWDSYKRGKKIDDWADFWAGVEYVYTITPEYKAKAKEEDCQSTIGE